MKPNFDRLDATPEESAFLWEYYYLCIKHDLCLEENDGQLEINHVGDLGKKLPYWFNDIRTLLK